MKPALKIKNVLCYKYELNVSQMLQASWWERYPQKCLFIKYGWWCQEQDCNLYPLTFYCYCLNVNLCLSLLVWRQSSMTQKNMKGSLYILFSSYKYYAKPSFWHKTFSSEKPICRSNLNKCKLPHGSSHPLFKRKI